MENQVATLDKNLLFEPANLTKDTIKKYLCPKASDQELMMGLQIAKTFNLNPLKREVYFVKYNEKDPMQVLTGYEVYLKRAERSGNYNGLEITSQGSIKNGDLKAVVKVFRKDWTNPLTHEAFYTEYVQNKAVYKDNVKIGEEPNKFWATKPITMIKKVAVSQAFRMAFPDEFDGMPYTSDEVIDQEKVIDVKSDSVSAMPVEQKSTAYLDPNEEKITSAQGEALLVILKNKGYTKDDLKQMIGDTWGLNGLMEVCNKHLPKIKEHFANQKEGLGLPESVG